MLTNGELSLHVWRKSEQRKSLRVHLWMTWSMVAIVGVCLLNIYSIVAYAYAMAIIFTTFVCPLWLKWMQRYKLYGRLPDLHILWGEDLSP